MQNSQQGLEQNNRQRRTITINTKLKKKIILNLPYIVIGWVGTKLAMAYRIADGEGLGNKLKVIGEAFDVAFAHPLPS